MTLPPVFPDVLDENGQRVDLRLLRWRKGYRTVSRLGAQGFAFSTFDGVLYVFTDTFGREHTYDGVQLGALSGSRRLGLGKDSLERIDGLRIQS